MSKDIFEDLKAVFGESIPWTGYEVPNINQMKIQPERPGNVRVPDGPSPGWAERAAFPFHTASAEKVWASVKKLMFKNKTAQTSEILRMAIEDSGVYGIDLTPEDAKLLAMAIDWARNGPPSPPISQLRSP